MTPPTDDLSAETERLRLQVSALTEERDTLRRTVEEMQIEIMFLTSLPKNADGLAAEIAMSRLLNLPRTLPNTSHDLGLEQCWRYEVKSSKVRVKRGNKYWGWTKVLGSRTRQKKYDYLLLLGKPDERFKHMYRDPNSPYVIFLIPYCEVYQFTTDDGDSIRRIEITTNPDVPKSLDSKTVVLFELPENS